MVKLPKKLAVKEMKNNIEGERIILRPWKKKDEKVLQRLVHDKSIARFTSIPYPYKLKQAREFIKHSQKGFREKTNQEYALILKETGEVAGCASLLDIASRYRKAEIGYWLGKKFRKKGFVKEAVQLLLKHGFEKMKLNRIVIKCHEGNKRSRKVIEKSGGKFEGIEREGAINGLGRKTNMRVYSILAQEFKKGKTGKVI